jgi:hypothetical protein
VGQRPLLENKRLHIGYGDVFKLAKKVNLKMISGFTCDLEIVFVLKNIRWMVVEPTFIKMLAVELWLSFLYGVYNGAMVVSLIEVVPTHVRTTCF